MLKGKKLSNLCMILIWGQNIVIIKMVPDSKKPKAINHHNFSGIL